MASGLITIVLGKCFGETCYDNIPYTGDFAELIGPGRPMTDVFFYEKIIESLYEINCESLQAVGYQPEYFLSPRGAGNSPLVRLRRIKDLAGHHHGRNANYDGILCPPTKRK